MLTHVYVVLVLLTLGAAVALAGDERESVLLPPLPAVPVEEHMTDFSVSYEPKAGVTVDTGTATSFGDSLDAIATGVAALLIYLIRHRLRTTIRWLTK